MSAGVVTFGRGGTHPPDNKELCDPSSYSVLPNPAELQIALAQHLGAPAKAVVANRDTVAANQLIGEASGFISANIHCPVAGTVRGLDKVHLGPVTSPSITIKPADDADPVPRFTDSPASLDLGGMEPKQIIDAIKDAGLVGMGGAAFPTHVKLSPPPGVKLDTVIINGAECEPYLTSDDCLMRNHPQLVLEGLRAIMRATGVERGYIGIENNKPEAYQSLKQAAEGLPGISLVRLKTRYPQGGEKQLIEAVVGRRVAPGQLPFTQGVVVQNVGTAAAIYEKLALDRPLARRLITISGRAVAQPQNVLAPLGASLATLLEYCGGLKDEVAQIVAGGPMMGRATTNLNEPVTKGTSGVLFLAPSEVEVATEEPCIRCGRCVVGCPMGLLPTDLMALAMRNRFEEALDALDCIECGTCSYACPADRRLVQNIRLAKWELGRLRRRAQMKEKEKEAKARA